MIPENHMSIFTFTSVGPLVRWYKEQQTLPWGGEGWSCGTRLVKQFF